MANTQYQATGRRKSSVARVRLLPGTGKITINKKDLELDKEKGLMDVKMRKKNDE